MNFSKWSSSISIESKGLNYRLTIIFSLFFLVPLLGFLFFAIKYDILDDEYIPIYFISLLIFSLFGYSMIRKIFDTIAQVSKNVTESTAHQLSGTRQDAANELEGIVVSFQSLERELRSSFGQLREKVSQISTLKELSDLCYVTFDTEDLFFITLERALKLVNADIGTVLILERPRRENFIVQASIGHGDKVKKGDRIDFGASIAKFAVINKSPLLVSDIETDNRFSRVNREQYGTKSFLCMPLKGINAVIGVLTISRRSGDMPFTQEDADILTPLLSNAAFTYDNLALTKADAEKNQLVKVMDMGFKMIEAKAMDLDMIHAFFYQLRSAVPFDLAIAMVAKKDYPSTLYIFDYLANMPADLVRNMDYPCQGSLLDKVMQQGNTMIINRLEHSTHPVEQELFHRQQLQSVGLSALHSKGECSGILVLGSQQEGAFTERQEQLELVASLLSMALERERLSGMVDKRDQEMDFMKQIGSILAASTFDIDEVIKHTLQMIQTVINVEAGSLLLLEDDELVFKESFNSNGIVNLAELKKLKLKLGMGIAGYVATRGEPILLRDVRSSQYFHPLMDEKTGFTTKSVLCVPLISKGRVLGVIEVLNKLKEEFTDGDLQLLQSIGTSVSIALENARLYQKTLAMAEQERSIRGMFQKFVPKEVVDRIAHNVTMDLPVTEELRMLTMLNIDLREFSSLSMNIGPRKTVAMLNHFFTVMGEIIFKHRGIVDKYLGDGFLALFGAPLSSSYDADNAISAALEMQAAMTEVNEFAKKLIDKPLKMGISIHTGEAVVGNIGFEKKMDYSVIGDAVNIVFRLQGMTKLWPNSILMTEKTYQSVIRSVVDVRKIEFAEASPQIGNLAIYEVLGQKHRNNLQ
ncbi:MAG: GAF domain-containing protein [Syntrophales bacterium]|jgi:class 3 adenylate cyclase|nr:GAF domain-containing protein [Syntrophales bacterium]